ncbi:hypothetical protein JOD62_001788 [Microbacterium keratanolyticum]|uniref:Lipoprotein n=1 Tax=Microbacterium keratanolyticum TaxID=67574 RepID=A0A9W6HSL9_9MICO|nr:hypothetical protein [Microbacterium keratanolyticum]MBM7469240.1 hypothetical protein [Microbacterium keratanolyticum]GLK01320.1 lipoprotein [Microbacterium keratanolyticum]
MTPRHATRAALLLAATLTLAACAPAVQPPDDPAPPAESAHGDFDGARELAEPALHLATVDGAGVVTHVDLIDGSSETLAEIDPVDELIGDGRFLFGVRDGSVSVIDSGVWTWSHGDHFHYYEAPSRVVGEIVGEGIATVVANDHGVGLRFADEAVLLDQKALGEARIVETFRVAADGVQGTVVPLSSGAAMTATAPDGTSVIEVVTAGGEPHSTQACTGAGGSITTTVGVVIGCADSALLSVGGSLDEWERIPAPADALLPTDFEGRKGRPRVAGLADDGALWMLDTRAREWLRHDIGEPIVRAAAIDDTEGRMVLLASTGDVLILQDGAIVARTTPLVTASLATPELALGISFVVDQQRVYLNGPAENTVWEIAPADGARISRTFDAQHPPLHLAGTGR